MSRKHTATDAELRAAGALLRCLERESAALLRGDEDDILTLAQAKVHACAALEEARRSTVAPLPICDPPEFRVPLELLIARAAAVNRANAHILACRSARVDAALNVLGMHSPQAGTYDQSGRYRKNGL